MFDPSPISQFNRGFLEGAAWQKGKYRKLIKAIKDQMNLQCRLHTCEMKEAVQIRETIVKCLLELEDK